MPLWGGLAHLAFITANKKRTTMCLSNYDK